MPGSGRPSGRHAAEIEARKTMYGCSITARRLPSGDYESGWRPMRGGCAHHPYLNDRPNFPAAQETLNEAKKQAGQ